MIISRRKFNVIILTAFLIVVEMIFTEVVLNSSSAMSVDELLRVVSFATIIVFGINIVIWKHYTGELLCPYIIFYLVLFVFCCGQSIGWGLNIYLGPSDMWYRNDHGLTHKLLLESMAYSMVALSVFQLGALFTAKTGNAGHKKMEDRQNFLSQEVCNAIRNTSKLFLLICIPAYIANTIITLMSAVNGGYLGTYEMAANRSTGMMLLNILSYYYQPCMLCLLVGYRENPFLRKVILLFMVIPVVIDLFVGGRSAAVMTVLSIVLTYHYFIKRFSKKNIIVFGITGYVGVAVLNAVAMLRQTIGRSIFDYLKTISSSFGSTIPTFLGELGWNITSLAWTMDLVPHSYNYRYGLTYLVSLISWIPSRFFPNGVSPVTTWSELADWLQKVLHMSYGPGYTMFAESYINFGWWGFIAIFFEGLILAMFIARVRRDETEDDLLGAIIQCMVIMVIMKSLVRSSVCVATRQIVYIMIPIVFLLKNSIRNTKLS